MADESEPTRMSGGEGWVPPSVERLQEVMPAYEILEMLGRGGMGAVYKARQKSLKRLVAIKILPLGLANDEFKFAERFRHEAETLAQMNHPAIVNVYDFGETPDGLLFFVMEFVNGTDVHKMIQASGRLPEEHALSITAHVCDALHYAHTHGVIHRDIKPANILINQEGHVKVADFGLAKMQDPSQTSALTLTNMTMGTPDYAAPEVFQPGATVDHRADLYAVGVMLYQMLTGRVPRGMFKLPSQRDGGGDPRFDEIIVKAMDANCDERYQSAMEVRHALDEILTTPLAKSEGTGAISKSALPPRSEVAPVAEPTPPSSPGKGKYFAIAAAVLVLGIAGFLVLNAKKKLAAVAQEHEPASAPANSTPMTAAPAASPAPGKAVDLLALVDPQRHSLAGPWSRSGADLLVGAWGKAAAEKASLLELPYQPPEEYDFEMEFTPEAELRDVSQVLSGFGHAFAWTMNGTIVGGKKSGFDLIDGQKMVNRKDGTVMRESFFTAGRRHHSKVEVRKGTVRGSLDGKLLVAWGSSPASYGRLTVPGHLSLRDASRLAIAADPSMALRVHRITVREITGTGKVDAGASPPAPQKFTADVGAWIDQLSTTVWSKRWSFKDGVLTPVVDGAYQDFGQAGDTALRVKVRPATGVQPSSAKRPGLQPVLRMGPVNGKPQRRGSYQFQAYVPGRSCALVYLEEDAGTRANPAPSEYLLNGLMLPEDLMGKPEIEWEFRAIGAELTIWADGQLVGSARDARVPSGSTQLAAYPGVEIVGVQTAKITTPLKATTAGNGPMLDPATTIDWLKTNIWRAPWVLEQGVLKSTGKDALTSLGTAEDGAIRMRLRDGGTPVTSAAPALQFKVRATLLATGKWGQYQFQIFTQKSTCTLIYLEKNVTTGAETTEMLWKEKLLPAAPGGGKELEFEFRAEGDTLSVWAASQLLASIRDARLSKGGISIISNPTVEITRLETVGVTSTKLAAAPAVDAPLPNIANWQDVTETLREKARVIPVLVVEADRVRHSGQGSSPRIPLTRDDARDCAVRIRFTGDAQVNLRANAGGFIYVLCQRTQTIFQRYDKGAIDPTVLRSSVQHPAGYDSTQPHEFLVTMQGTTIRAWLDGRFIGEAQESTFKEGTADIAFTKFSVVLKAEIAELAADAPK